MLIILGCRSKLIFFQCPCVIDGKPTSTKYLDGNLNNLSCITTIHNGCKSVCVRMCEYCVALHIPVCPMGKDNIKVMLLYACPTMTIYFCLSVYLFCVCILFCLCVKITRHGIKVTVNAVRVCFSQNTSSMWCHCR